MKIHKMLRAVLTALVLALVVVMTSWFASEHQPALAPRRVSLEGGPIHVVGEGGTVDIVHAGSP